MQIGVVIAAMQLEDKYKNLQIQLHSITTKRDELLEKVHRSEAEVVNLRRDKDTLLGLLASKVMKSFI